MAPLIPIALTAALGYFVWDKYANRIQTPAPGEPRTVPQTPPIQNQQGLPRVTTTVTLPNALPPVASSIGVTPGGNPVVTIGPVDQSTGLALPTSQLATTGLAVPQAHALFDYLMAKGAAVNPTLTGLVTAFQTAHNADPNAVRIAGKIPATGAYDLRTSAALTVYTGQPILPTLGAALDLGDVSTWTAPALPGMTAPPPIAQAGNILSAAVASVNQALATGSPQAAGPAALTGSNLYAYLKAHPRKGTSPTENANADPGLKAATLAFQLAVNSDPKYPGPASPFPDAAIIKKKLTADGIYGKNTADALAVVTFERIA